MHSKYVLKWFLNTMFVWYLADYQCVVACSFYLVSLLLKVPFLGIIKL